MVWKGINEHEGTLLTRSKKLFISVVFNCKTHLIYFTAEHCM